MRKASMSNNALSILHLSSSLKDSLKILYKKDRGGDSQRGAKRYKISVLFRGKDHFKNC